MTSPDNRSAQPDARWLPGAEPVALCMSCQAEFEPGTVEVCPKCQVGLSFLRNCPRCQRSQSASHLRCVYCRTSFLAGDEAGADETGLYKASRRQASYPAAVVLGSVLAAAAVVGVVVYTRLTPPSKPKGPIGQSYILGDAALRRDPSLRAPLIKDLHSPQIVIITDYVFDRLGNHWFGISSQGLSGYVLARELAPPKPREAETGSAVLRHSLLALEDPAVLPEAEAAVDYYQRVFLGSPHVDELRWLLAETTRKLADGRPALRRRAQEEYTKIAEGNGEFAERARQMLARPRAPAENFVPRAASSSQDTFGLTVEGGSLSPGGSVHSLTVLSRTPLFVRVTEPVQISPETSFQGEIEQEIRVNDEIAVPKGSVCRLKVVRVSGKAAPDPGATWVTLRLTAIVVGGQTYQVSAGAVRVEPPDSSAAPSPAHTQSSQLSPGTRLTFRLVAPLLVKPS
jgi:hypothetical protein